MKPKSYCDSACPCSAAAVYHRTASASSFPPIQSPVAKQAPSSRCALTDPLISPGVIELSLLVFMCHRNRKKFLEGEFDQRRGEILSAASVEEMTG